MRLANLWASQLHRHKALAGREWVKCRPAPQKGPQASLLVASTGVASQLAPQCGPEVVPQHRVGHCHRECQLGGRLWS